MVRALFPILLLAGLAQGCGASIEAGGRDLDAGLSAPLPHPPHAFVALYGADRFRVNLQFVQTIGRTVIAVRQGARDRSADGWARRSLMPRLPVPGTGPFGTPANQVIAVDIAKQTVAAGDWCPRGRLSLSTGQDGAIRTIYRDLRQAWVIFAACRERIE